MSIKFTVSDYKPLKMAEGITGLPLGLDKVMVNIVDLDEGAIVPLHKHPEEQVTLILKGALEFELEGESFVLHTGEGVLIPANAEHWARAAKPTLAYDCFSPPRKDYLEKVKAG
jgi:quercetin dioxygenase-like cupin family protein